MSLGFSNCSSPYHEGVLASITKLVKWKGSNWCSLGLADGKENLLWKAKLVNVPHQVFVAPDGKRMVRIDTFGSLAGAVRDRLHAGHAPGTGGRHLVQNRESVAGFDRKEGQLLIRSVADNAVLKRLPPPPDVIQIWFFATSF